MSNPRPCECGHLEGPHLTFYGHPGLCRPCIGRYKPCNSYRPAQRREPLRAAEVKVSERHLRQFLDADIKAARGLQSLLTTEEAKGILYGRIYQAQRIRAGFCREELDG